MKYRTARLVSNLLFLAAFLAAVSLAWIPSQTIGLYVAMAVALVCLVAGFRVQRRFYRCPFCGKNLAALRSLATPKVCPRCGKDLTDQP